MSDEDKSATDAVEITLRENLTFENEEIAPLGESSSDSPVARPLANETKWSLNSMLSRPKFLETFTIAGGATFRKVYSAIGSRALKNGTPLFTQDFINHFGMFKFDHHLMVTLTTNQYQFGSCILGLMPVKENPHAGDTSSALSSNNMNALYRLFKYIDYSTQDGADICNPFSRPRPYYNNYSARRLQAEDEGQNNFYYIVLKDWTFLRGPVNETPTVTFKVFSYVDNISYDYYRLTDRQ